jgi:hypothetical protein
MSNPARRRDELRDWAVDRLSATLSGGYKAACRGVPALMAEHLDADVVVRFIAIRSAGLTGGTARCLDGSYIVYCAKSGSWYHRFGVLLHELAHALLGHHSVELSNRESLRRFLPNLPDGVIELMAGRTDLAAAEEQAAEELADSILARLTDAAPRPQHADLDQLPDHVRRVADAFVDPEDR